MGLSRILATKYGIFEEKTGSVTCTKLKKPTFHGEKWVRHGCCANNIDLHHGEKRGFHGSGLQTMVFLT